MLCLRTLIHAHDPFEWTEQCKQWGTAARNGARTMIAFAETEQRSATKPRLSTDTNCEARSYLLRHGPPVRWMINFMPPSSGRSEKSGTGTETGDCPKLGGPNLDGGIVIRRSGEVRDKTPGPSGLCYWMIAGGTPTFRTLLSRMINLFQDLNTIPSAARHGCEATRTPTSIP